MARSFKVRGERGLRGGLKVSSLITGGGIPSLHSWFADGGDGLLFDFTKLDRHFQENTGPTLADDVGESIGLALDQHSWAGKTLAAVVAAQSELITNGGPFTNTTGITGTSATLGVSGGILSITATALNGRAEWPVSGLTVGRVYKVVVRARRASGTGQRIQSWTWGTITGATLTDSFADYVFYVLATSTSGVIRLYANAVNTASDIMEVESLTMKLVPGFHGVQSSATLKPTRQTSGAKFDGSDDNLLTTYLAGSGANSIVALVTVPASLAAAQAIVGASLGATGRLWLAINTSGFLYWGVGSSVATGTEDIRGRRLVVGLSASGGSMNLFVDSAINATESYSGSPDTATPIRIGAQNAAGSALSHFGGSIEKLMTLRKALTLADYLKIRARMLID